MTEKQYKELSDSLEELKKAFNDFIDSLQMMLLDYFQHLPY